MSLDVIDLRDYYASPLGQLTKFVLRAKLRARWDDVRGLRLLGYGFATPFLGPYRYEAERVLAFMPAHQGVLNWPARDRVKSALVEPDMWPITDAAIDRIMLVHALENAASPDDVMRECWRVLVPGGRILCVVPSRRGPWARFETTPFGHGRPYSGAQLTRLLRESGFRPERPGAALFFPPLRLRMLLRSGITIERLGAWAWPPFAGVHIVEAVKEFPRPARVRRVIKVALKPAPVLAPGAAQPAPFNSASAETPPAFRTDSRTTTAR